MSTKQIHSANFPNLIGGNIPFFLILPYELDIIEDKSYKEKIELPGTFQFHSGYVAVLG
jgi:hypothetical protein